jgi:tetratricopeptide (TPR) repeat protein
MTQQTSDDSFMKLSRDLFKQKRYAEAAEILQIMLEKDPRDEVVLEMLGMARFYNKEFEAAREVFESHTKQNSGHAQAWVNLGAVLNRLGEFRKAVEALRRALQKDRKCAEAYYNMGIAQRGQNLNTMAISAYKEAIKLKPDLIEAHLNLGNIYVDMKNMGLALRCFQTAIQLDPNSKKARASLEKAQATQKNARKEVSPFGRLVNIAELDRQNVETGPRELDAASAKSRARTCSGGDSKGSGWHQRDAADARRDSPFTVASLRKNRAAVRDTVFFRGGDGSLRPNAG